MVVSVLGAFSFNPYQGVVSLPFYRGKESLRLDSNSSRLRDGGLCGPESHAPILTLLISEQSLETLPCSLISSQGVCGAE